MRRDQQEDCLSFLRMASANVLEEVKLSPIGILEALFWRTSLLIACMSTARVRLLA